MGTTLGKGSGPAASAVELLVFAAGAAALVGVVRACVVRNGSQVLGLVASSCDVFSRHFTTLTLNVQLAFFHLPS